MYSFLTRRQFAGSLLSSVAKSCNSHNVGRCHFHLGSCCLHCCPLPPLFHSFLPSQAHNLPLVDEPPASCWVCCTCPRTVPGPGSWASGRKKKMVKLIWGWCGMAGVGRGGKVQGNRKGRDREISRWGKLMHRLRP